MGRQRMPTVYKNMINVDKIYDKRRLDIRNIYSVNGLGCSPSFPFSPSSFLRICLVC